MSAVGGVEGTVSRRKRVSASIGSGMRVSSGDVAASSSSGRGSKDGKSVSRGRSFTRFDCCAVESMLDITGFLTSFVRCESFNLSIKSIMSASMRAISLRVVDRLF